MSENSRGTSQTHSLAEVGIARYTNFLVANNVNDGQIECVCQDLGIIVKV